MAVAVPQPKGQQGGRRRGGRAGVPAGASVPAGRGGETGAPGRPSLVDQLRRLPDERFSELVRAVDDVREERGEDLFLKITRQVAERHRSLAEDEFEAEREAMDAEVADAHEAGYRAGREDGARLAGDVGDAESAVKALTDRLEAAQERISDLEGQVSELEGQEQELELRLRELKVRRREVELAERELGEREAGARGRAEPSSEGQAGGATRRAR